jgi:hypothetical protein
MEVTEEERERLKELSRWSSGLAPRGGHTDRRTVEEKAQKGKAPAHTEREYTQHTNIQYLNTVNSKIAVDEQMYCIFLTVHKKTAGKTFFLTW